MLFPLLLTQAETVFPLQAAAVENVQQAGGPARRDLSIGGKPLTVAGTTYERGIGTRAPGEIWVRLDGNGVRFRAKVGVDAEEGGKGTVRFHVWADEKEVATSPVMRAETPAFGFDVDLKGVSVLRLTSDDGGDGSESDHADWVEPTVSLANPTALPKILPFERGVDLPVAPVDRETTRLNGPRTVGATAGGEFQHRIPASGKRPLVFSAKGLPPGVTLDPKTGVLRGTIAAAGETDVRLEAKGPGGRDARTLRISASSTPPKGGPALEWILWGDDDAGERAGLVDFGYRGVVWDDPEATDDWWAMSAAGFAPEGERRFGPLAVGRIDPKAPRPTRLSRNEQITQVSLWALRAGELVTGSDPGAIDVFTGSLLMNPEVIDLVGDAPGGARRVRESMGTEVWVHPLDKGATVVGLFNRGIATAVVTVDVKALGVKPDRKVRNVWTRKDEGVTTETLARSVPPQGAVLLRIG